MNKDISLLKCEEEKGSEMGGKAYPVLNSLKLNFLTSTHQSLKKTWPGTTNSAEELLPFLESLGNFWHMFLHLQLQVHNVKTSNDKDKVQ